MECSLYILVQRPFQILGLDIRICQHRQDNKHVVIFPGLLHQLQVAQCLCNTRQNSRTVDKRSDSVLWCSRGSVDGCGNLHKTYMGAIFLSTENLEGCITDLSPTSAALPLLLLLNMISYEGIVWWVLHFLWSVSCRQKLISVHVLLLTKKSTSWWSQRGWCIRSFCVGGKSIWLKLLVNSLFCSCKSLSS